MNERTTLLLKRHERVYMKSTSKEYMDMFPNGLGNYQLTYTVRVSRVDVSRDMPLDALDADVEEKKIGVDQFLIEPEPYNNNKNGVWATEHKSGSIK